MRVDDHAVARAVAALPGAAAGRYQQRRELGGGGMALVFEVHDTVTGQNVALKQLRPMREEAHARRAAELLAREYHTLAGLAHPGIVAVYDYGAEGPLSYYTMELLDGGDLDALAPCDPLRVCAIAREVCSALSFLHARQLLHRDVSAANIRCTAEGTAKLIDFGTVMHMGPCKLLIGTPVYCPPEALYMQPLDARADLFALGTTMYFALTGQHAYPAWDFPSLPGAWQRRPQRPSAIVPTVPSALDQLVMQLIEPERELRPRTAAEIMERLSAIEERTLPERTEVVNAYLTMPPFVGREFELARVKRQAARASNGRGGSLLVRGPAGAGMSRFLDASILAAKISGFLVLRADASDAADGDCGVLRRLLRQLTRLMPELLDTLGEGERHALAPLLPVAPDAAPAPRLVIGRAVELVQRLILEAAERHALLIAIDELDAVDEPSLSLLVMLTQASATARLLILASATYEAQLRAPVPFGMFARAASEIALALLSQLETEQLLSSVFGVQGSVNLSLLAERMHRLAAGNPRSLMLLAQHLADAGVAHYEQGAWSLPADVAHAELPGGVTELLAGRLSALQGSARQLACAFALCPELSFSLDECLQLSEHTGPAQLLADLAELVRLQIVRGEEGLYTLCDRAFVPVLLRELAADNEALLLTRLAGVFAGRPNGYFRQGSALWRAGKRATAIEVFLAANRAVRPDIDDAEALSAVVRSLPADWSAVCREVSVGCRELGFSRLDEYTLRYGWALLLSIAGNDDVGDPQLGVLVTMAVEASMLPEYMLLSAAEQMSPAERFQLALERAQQRYEATPEPLRLMDPVAAITGLKDCVRYALAAAAPAYDVATVRALPSFEPFYVLAPALSLIDDLRRGLHARLTGRADEARAIYHTLLDTLEREKLAGLDEAGVEYTRMFVMSALIAFEASLGIRWSEGQLMLLEKHLVFSVLARSTRGLVQLWMGDVAQAEATLQAAELMRLRSGAAQVFERVSLLWQLQAYVALEDAARTKQTLAELAPLAYRFPGWEPFLVYGQAELQRMQGNPAALLLKNALARVQPGDHLAWALLAAAQLRALDALGYYEEAIQSGYAQLEAAAGLGPTACQPVLLALSLALARAGDARASELADRAIANIDRLGAVGLNRALAHEARAWVALMQQDRARCEEEIKRIQASVNTQPGSAFCAKLERLKQAAMR